MYSFLFRPKDAVEILTNELQNTSISSKNKTKEDEDMFSGFSLSQTSKPNTAKMPASTINTVNAAQNKPKTNDVLK